MSANVSARLAALGDRSATLITTTIRDYAARRGRSAALIATTYRDYAERRRLDEIADRHRARSSFAGWAASSPPRVASTRSRARRPLVRMRDPLARWGEAAADAREAERLEAIVARARLSDGLLGFYSGATAVRLEADAPPPLLPSASSARRSRRPPPPPSASARRRRRPGGGRDGSAPDRARGERRQARPRAQGGGPGRRRRRPPRRRRRPTSRRRGGRASRAWRCSSAGGLPDEAAGERRQPQPGPVPPRRAP